MKAQLAVLGLGGWEIVLILAVLILLFGASRLPKLAKGLGESVSELRKAARETSNEASPKIPDDKSAMAPEAKDGANREKTI